MSYEAGVTTAPFRSLYGAVNPLSLALPNNIGRCIRRPVPHLVYKARDARPGKALVPIFA